MKLYDYADRLREYFPSLSPKDVNSSASFNDKQAVELRRQIQIKNEKKLQQLKEKATDMIKFLKEIKQELRDAIDKKCVYEAGGGNLLSMAGSNKTVSKNELEELKEIAKQDAKKENDGSVPRVVNPETLFYSLKQLGETLGLDNQKFMQLSTNPPLKGIVTR